MLAPVDELDFIYRLSLRNLKRNSYGLNFSCPLCYEGKSPWKTRGFILFANGKVDHNSFVCHNCSRVMSVKSFIREIDPALHDEYIAEEKRLRIEELRSGRLSTLKRRYIRPEVPPPADLKIFSLSPRTFIPARSFEPAVEYCVRRAIPDEVIDGLMYCPKKNLPFGEMVIFPFYTGEEDKVYGFQGRTIRGKRFNTFSTNDSFKVYNIFSVDVEKTVYVFESIIDSLHTANSIAMLGSDLSERAKEKLKNPVYVFDNDKTGIIKALKYATNGERVFVWPEEIKSKDVNDLVANKGVTPSQVEFALKTFTKDGFEARAMLNLKLSKMKR